MNATRMERDWYINSKKRLIDKSENRDNWFDFDKSDIKEYETMTEKVQMYKEG